MPRKSFKNIAAAAAADVCMSPPARSPIESAEPSTPPSRGRYSLRRSPHAEAADAVVPRALIMPSSPKATTALEEATGSGAGGIFSDDKQTTGGNAREEEEEEKAREVARISELEATRRGVAPAPDEVRTAHTFALSFHCLFGIFVVPNRRLSFVPPNAFCFSRGLHAPR
jgi:hypothetical protein